MMRDEHGRPKALFKTLRLMHGHNIDSGLNDLTEAFANFVTRARYFSIGHVRRTWSHSAVEFMKYRRRLPALTASGDGDEDDYMGDLAYSPRTSESEDPSEGFHDKGMSMGLPPTIPAGMSDPRRVYIANVPTRVTLKQLASFFTKFGRVASCTLPVDKPTSTVPRRTKGCAFITFRNSDEAEVARKAQPHELTLYDRVMVVTTAAAAGIFKKRHSIHSSVVHKGDAVHDDEDDASLASLSSAAYGESSEADASSPSSPNYGGPSVNSLPNKALATIISYLPLTERIRVERVSKRWQEAAFESWSHEKRLSFRRTFASFRTRPLTNHAFKEVMRRCGPNVQSLDASGGPAFMNDQCLKIVADHCPNLKEVNFTGLKVRWQALKTFAEACGPRLESVTYRDAYFLPEKAFWWLFRFSPQLRRVDLGNARRLNGHCFRLLSFPLEDVRLDGCTRLDPDGVEQLCLKSPRVKRLCLDYCQRVTDETVALIARCMNELESFSLRGGPFHSVTTVGLKQIAKLSTLRKLYLDGNAQVDDDTLAAVAEGCTHLSALTLAQAGTDEKLTKQGLLALTMCMKLTEIDFSYLNGCQDTVITELAGTNPNLQVVRLCGCSRLTDTGIRGLADKCWKNLRELDISGCVAVSNRSMERFLDGQSGHGPVLTVVLGGTSCETPKLIRRIDSMKGAARLAIDPTDTSKQDLLATAGAAAGLKQFDIGEGEFDEDDELSDDEFESLTAQRSFVLGELEQDDDDDLLDSGEDLFANQAASAAFQHLQQQAASTPPKPAIGSPSTSAVSEKSPTKMNTAGTSVAPKTTSPSKSSKGSPKKVNP